MLPSSGALDPVKAPLKTVLFLLIPVGAGLVPARLEYETNLYRLLYPPAQRKIY
jgi:hypothetical protein